MGRFFRNLGAVVAGLLAGLVFIMIVEGVSSRVYPFPAGVDPADAESVKTYIAQLPMGAFMFVLLAWGGGALIGSLLATLLSADRRPRSGVVVGVLFLAAAVADMLMLPHPGWFWAVSLLLLAACTIAGTKLGTARA